MESSLRASAFAGLGAFILSIIVAVFSRVPFGALMFRALLSGTGFACLSFVALWILQRSIPDLFDDSARSPRTALDAGVGSIVDIVLPGGDELAAEGLTDQPGASRNARDDGTAGYVSSLSLASGEIEQEVADLRADALVPNDPSDASTPGAGYRLLRPSVGLDELDTLPDLEGMSDSFAGSMAGSPDDDGPSPGDASSRFGVSDSMPTAGSPKSGQDPALLAKAVQTLLRRDQKGQ